MIDTLILPQNRVLFNTFNADELSVITEEAIFKEAFSLAIKMMTEIQ